MQLAPVTTWPAPSTFRQPVQTRLSGWVRTRGWFTGLVVPLIAVYVLLPYLTPLLLGAVALVGCLLTKARWGAAGWFTGWACGLYALLAVTGGVTLDRTGHARPAVLLLLGALQLLLARPVPSEKPGPLDSRLLAPALVRAGILKKLADGQAPKVLYRSGYLRDPRGVARKIDLGSATYDDALARRTALAGQLKVAERSLLMSHDPADPPTVITLWIGNPKPTDPIPSPLATVERTDWRAPVRLGTDQQGQPVTLSMDENNVIVGGRMGFGKTVTVRLLLAHYLLDPTVTLYGLDGKGSKKDYQPMAPLCARWVWGTDPDPVPAVQAMFEEVLRIVQDRNSSHHEPAGGWPALVLLLEEYQDVRAAAGDACDELDLLLGRIVRMGRAVACQVIVSTQRPTKDDLPTGVRNLLSIGVCLNVRNGEDARIVLGTTPDLSIPARKGEAIVGTPAGQRLVDVDLLDLPGWKALCARAAALRTAAVPVSLVKPPKPAAPRQDPFATRISALLLEHGPLTSTELYDRLPALLRPGNLTAFGRALGALETVERGWRNGTEKVWRPVGGPAGEPVGDPLVPAQNTVRNPLAGGVQSRPHAQTAPVEANPLVGSVAP